jgi:hypothetical protein
MPIFMFNMKTAILKTCRILKSLTCLVYGGFLLYVGQSEGALEHWDFNWDHSWLWAVLLSMGAGVVLSGITGRLRLFVFYVAAIHAGVFLLFSPLLLLYQRDRTSLPTFFIVNLLCPVAVSLLMRWKTDLERKPN